MGNLIDVFCKYVDFWVRCHGKWGAPNTHIFLIPGPHLEHLPVRDLHAERLQVQWQEVFGTLTGEAEISGLKNTSCLPSKCSHLMFTFEMQPFQFLFSSLHSHLPGFCLNLGPLSLLISPAFLALDRFSSSLGKHSCLGGPFVCEHQSSTNANVPTLEEKPWIVEAYFNSLHWLPYRPESCDHNRASCIFYVHVALSLILWFYLLFSLTLSSSLSAHYFYCHP